MAARRLVLVGSSVEGQGGRTYLSWFVEDSDEDFAAGLVNGVKKPSSLVFWTDYAEELGGALLDHQRPATRSRGLWILVMVTCALFAEVETFVDIADWAELKEPWLRRFLLLKNGLLLHDTLNRMFRLLDPKVFATVFTDWVGEQGDCTYIAYRSERQERLCDRVLVSRFPSAGTQNPALLA